MESGFKPRLVCLKIHVYTHHIFCCNGMLLLLLSHFSHVQLCETPWTAAYQAPPSLDSPGKNTGVGCHFLLQCMKVKRESEVSQCVQPLATPWTAAYQAPLSMGFSRQEYWSGLPLPSLIIKFIKVTLTIYFI